MPKNPEGWEHLPERESPEDPQENGENLGNASVHDRIEAPEPLKDIEIPTSTKKESGVSEAQFKLLMERGFSVPRFATPEWAEEALLFETQEEFELEKLKNDPINKFVRDAMGQDPAEFGFSYKTIDIDSFRKHEEEGGTFNSIQFRNYHDYLAYRRTLSQDDKDKIDRTWVDHQKRDWKAPDIFAGEGFWKRVNDEAGDLHEFYDQIHELRGRVLTENEEDTFEEVLAERREQRKEAVAGEIEKAKRGDFGDLTLRDSADLPPLGPEGFVVPETLEEPPASSEEPPADTEAAGAEASPEKIKPKPNRSRGETRAEKGKKWEEMSEEERREKYGKHFERAERLYNFEKTRANLIKLEEELNKLSSWPARALARVSPEKRLYRENIEREYNEVFARYNEARAERVGSEAWLLLNEKMRVAEQEANRHQEGEFEKLREKWRWLGDQNLDKFLSGTKLQPKNKFTKFAARMVSLRTAASLSLLGGGMVIGFGSATGLGILAARRVMGGAGVAFGSHDLMSMASEKAALGAGKGKIEDMHLNEIEEKMATLEARAKFSGQRIISSPEYTELRGVYVKKIKEHESARSDSTRPEVLQQSITYIDGVLRYQKREAAKAEKQRKVAAVGIGLFSAGAFSASSIAKLLEEKPEFVGVTPEQIQEAVREGPIVTPEDVQGSAEVSLTIPEVSIEMPSSESLPEVPPPPPGMEATPDSTPDIATPTPEATPGPEALQQPPVADAGPDQTVGEEVIPEVTSPDTSRVVTPPQEAIPPTNETPPAAAASPDTSGAQVEAPEVGADSTRTEITAEAAAERLDQTDGNVSTIREGGSVWNATRRLVENGAITEDQFKEALENPASMATLASGTEVHISELHLTHEGDQVVYVPGEGEAPGRFEVIDYTEDEFALGNAEALADAMKREGHWGHQAHEWLYDKLDEYPEGFVSAAEGAPNLEAPSLDSSQVDLSQSPELKNLLEDLDKDISDLARMVPEGVTPSAEALKQAAEGMLEVAEQEFNLGWGAAKFVTDSEGRIADVIFDESLNPISRGIKTTQAAEQLLKPDYNLMIGQYMRESMEGLKPLRMRQAKEFAWQVFRLNELLGSVDSGSKEAEFIHFKIQSIMKRGEFMVGARVFKPLNN